jgi:hypothetical protein
MWDRDERAQVYARDRRLADDAPWVYLARGAADAYREAAREGHLVCPLPDCGRPELVVRAGSRRDHFAHRVTPAGDHSPERIMHLQGKAMIAGWLRGLFNGGLVVGEEVRIGGGDRIADVLARSRRGGRMAFEVQYAPLTVDEWRARHADYAAQDIVDVWLWGHIVPHCRRPAGDHADAERSITPPMAEYARHTGRPVLWINPEEQLLAIGATRPDLDLSDELSVFGVSSSTQLSWAFHDRRSALAVASGIANWTLDADGPTSAARCQVEEMRERRRAREAAAQRERERVAAERARREAQRAAHAARLEKHAEELADRRRRHAERDLARWQRESPALLARIGGSLPSVIAQPLKADRFVFMASEHWHAIVYEAHLHNIQPGDTFSYGDVCRTVFSALTTATDIRIRNGRQIYPAITALLFHLRRHNWVTFETSPGSWYISGEIGLGDAHPRWRPHHRFDGASREASVGSPPAHG